MSAASPHISGSQRGAGQKAGFRVIYVDKQYVRTKNLACDGVLAPPPVRLKL